jgi:hypothetical protein
MRLVRRRPVHTFARQRNSGSGLLGSSNCNHYRVGMGENIAQQNTGHGQTRRKRPGRPTAEAIGRNLLNILVYAKGCRVGDKVVLDDLAETSEVGDWMMPDFKMACTYAASQGWLVIEGDTLTLTTAGSAAA